MDILLARDHGQLELTPLVDGTAQPSERLGPAELPARVAALEGPDVRWVWADTRTVYPTLLAAGQTALPSDSSVRQCRSSPPFVAAVRCPRPPPFSYPRGGDHDPA